MTEHVERVAAAVPERARAVAFLHDVLEKTDVRAEDLRVRGLTPTERSALDLLTRRDGETFEGHALRIGDAAGPAGVMARSVKLADLDDHIGQARSATGNPPYRWAHEHILAAQRSRREAPAELAGGARP